MVFLFRGPTSQARFPSLLGSKPMQAPGSDSEPASDFPILSTVFLACLLLFELGGTTFLRL